MSEGVSERERVDKKDVKGTVHLKKNILSSFTHPYVVPNLFDLLSPMKLDLVLFYLYFLAVHKDGEYQIQV